MIETVIPLDFSDAVPKKNQENDKIGNRKQSAVPIHIQLVVVLAFISIATVFCSILSLMNRTQPKVKPCKAEIWKGKNQSSMRRQHAELKSSKNNEL